MDHKTYLEEVQRHVIECVKSAFNGVQMKDIWEEFTPSQQQFFRNVYEMFKERIFSFFNEITEEKYFKPYNNIMVTHRIIINELLTMNSFLTSNVIETLMSTHFIGTDIVNPELNFKFDHNKRIIRTICVTQYYIKQNLEGYLAFFLADGIAVYNEGVKKKVNLCIDLTPETLPFFTEEWDSALKYYQQLKGEVGETDYKLPKITLVDLYK